MEGASMVVLVTGAFLGAFVCGLSGFAYALVAHAVWAHAIDPHVAVPLAVAGALLVQGLTLPRLWRRVEVVRLWPLFAGGLAGIPFGLLLLSSVEGGWFRPLIGALLLVFAVRAFVFKRLPRLVFAGADAAEAPSAAGGVLQVGARLGAALSALWRRLRGSCRHQQRSMAQLFILTLQFVALLVYLLTGTFDLAWNAFAFLCVPAVLLGAFGGFALYQRVDDRVFGIIVRTLLGISGASLILV